MPFFIWELSSQTCFILGNKLSSLSSFYLHQFGILVPSVWMRGKLVLMDSTASEKNIRPRFLVTSSVIGIFDLPDQDEFYHVQ